MTSSSQSNAFPFRVCLIPTFPNVSQATELFHRVIKEFQPIIERRNYNVLSISEMCCCNDGLDFEDNNRKGSKRKRKIMGSNVWGYNQITTIRSRYNNTNSKHTSHTIHIRLRNPKNHHQLLSYEDVAGTLAHELAHCERAPHDAQFYKVMDSILEEHTQLRIGQQTTQQHANANAMNTQQLTGGHKLGGDPTFICWMTPKEAAVAAAECRRRQHMLRHRGDSGCCQTIQIDDDEEDKEKENNDSNGRINRKRPRKDANLVNSTPEVVDLTTSADESVTEQVKDWPCHCCTYRNRAMALACDVCRSERLF